MSRTQCLRKKTYIHENVKYMLLIAKYFRNPNTQNNAVLGRIKISTQPRWSSERSSD